MRFKDCYTGVFDKYDNFAWWGDKMEPIGTSNAKNQNWKNLELHLFTLVWQYSRTLYS